jgi:hypothetical protein
MSMTDNGRVRYVAAYECSSSPFEIRNNLTYCHLLNHWWHLEARP